MSENNLTSEQIDALDSICELLLHKGIEYEVIDKLREPFGLSVNKANGFMVWMEAHRTIEQNKK